MILDHLIVYGINRNIQKRIYGTHDILQKRNVLNFYTYLVGLLQRTYSERMLRVTCNTASKRYQLIYSRALCHVQ